jgi:cytochrome c-type biogenesis protein CcmE
MTFARPKLIVAAVLVVTAVSYLAFAGARKGWVYTLAVDNYVNQPEYHNQRARLCGKVAVDGLVSKPAMLTATFTLCGKEKTIPVSYHGVIPDLFKAGCEVVVEGQQNPAGVFECDLMMTKCASKYEQGANHEQGTKP